MQLSKKNSRIFLLNKNNNNSKKEEKKERGLGVKLKRWGLSGAFKGICKIIIIKRSKINFF